MKCELSDFNETGMKVAFTWVSVGHVNFILALIKGWYSIAVPVFISDLTAYAQLKQDVASTMPQNSTNLIHFAWAILDAIKSITMY